MVRLRRPMSYGLMTRGQRFNPTMVRLRQWEVTISRVTITVSIPLWCDCDAKAGYAEIVETSFNPTMVRLRPLGDNVRGLLA